MTFKLYMTIVVRLSQPSGNDIPSQTVASRKGAVGSETAVTCPKDAGHTGNAILVRPTPSGIDCR